MILAGDIGGTNARFAFFEAAGDKLAVVSEAVFPSRQYRTLDEIVANLLATSGMKPTVACLGIAGPVRYGRVETSNLPWVVEEGKLAAETGIPRVHLLNDLEANAWGIEVLQDGDLVSLNHVKADPAGNRVVVSAGTGLGEAGLYWDGKRHLVFASEGGHTDFAPRNDLEIDLLLYLRKRFGRVSYERIISGPGLVNVYNFLRDSGHGTEPAWLAEEMSKSDPAAVISTNAAAAKCPLCEHAVDIFVSVYGAEAGNMALKVMAAGGVFLGGGIAPRMISKFCGPLFLQSFLAKGRMQALLETIPVYVIANPKTALLGAARCAASGMAGA
jgi:glucokinase